MYCLSCGTENAETAKFCKKCGTKLSKKVALSSVSSNYAEKIEDFNPKRQDRVPEESCEAVETALKSLKKSKRFINQAEKQIRQCKADNHDEQVALKSALSSNRVALEAYYNAIRELYEITDEMIDIYREFDEIKKRKKNNQQNYTRFKFLGVKKQRIDIVDNQNFILDHCSHSPEEKAVLDGARDFGNLGSHFKSKKLLSGEVAEVCSATKGLIDIEIFYWSYWQRENLKGKNDDDNKSKNLVKKEFNFRKCEVYEKTVLELSRMQEGSFSNCEDLSGKIDEEEKYLRRDLSYSDRHYHDNCKHEYKKNLNDTQAINLKLSELLFKYTKKYFELNGANQEEELQAYEELYSHLYGDNIKQPVGQKIQFNIRQLKEHIKANDEGRSSADGDSALAFLWVIIIAVIVMAIFCVFFSR